MRIRGVANLLFVKDFERMTTFYETALSLEAEPSPYDGWRRYRVGAGSFELHAIPAMYATDIVIEDPAAVRGGTAIKPIFYVDDVAEARAELVATGVRVLDPERQPNDQFEDFVDPEGNVFQVAQTPG